MDRWNFRVTKDNSIVYKLKRDKGQNKQLIQNKHFYFIHRFDP